jgi:hypothetical protein
MTDVDLKRELAGLLEGEPSTGPDAMRALRSGRRARIRRRYTTSAAGLVAVVAVAAAVPFGFSLASDNGGGGTSPAGASDLSPTLTASGRAQAARQAAQDAVDEARLRAELESSAIDPGLVADMLRSTVAQRLAGASLAQGTLQISPSPFEISSTYVVTRGTDTWTVLVSLTYCGCGIDLAPDTATVHTSYPSAGTAVVDRTLGVADAYHAPGVSRTRDAGEQASPDGWQTGWVTSATSVAAVQHAGTWDATSHEASADTAWVHDLADAIAASMPPVDHLGHFGAMAEASTSSQALPSATPSAKP